MVRLDAVTLLERFAARFGPPDGESTFECSACGTETDELLIDCPDCGVVVVRVVLDPDWSAPEAADTSDLAR